MRTTPFLRALLASALFVSLPALASPDEKKGGDAFGDLFGDSLSGAKQNKLGELEQAAGEVKTNAQGDALQPKGKTDTGNEGVEFLDQFVAERVQITKKEGCIPAEPQRVRVTYLEYLEFPAKSPKLSLCLKMSSRVNRQVRLTATIVNPRLKRVGRAESVVSFAGATRTDHVLDYPELHLDMAGPYQLLIDIDGKPAAKLPLFDVRVAH